MSDENKQVVEKINTSFAEGDTEGFLSYCAENIKWTMFGEKSVEGKSAVREWMSSMEGMEPPKFTVDNLIADGDFVVSSGNMTMKDKEGKTAPYAYCDIYRFGGGKIAELRSFVIKTADAERSASA